MSPRLEVVSRVTAAIVGGYALAYGFTAFLTMALPMGRLDRVAFATMFAFAAWCAAAIYVFAARSARRAWCAPLGLGLALWAVTLIFPEAAARP